MSKSAHLRLIVIGIILAIAGFVAKFQTIVIPDWLACASLTLGLATVIFAIGTRSADALRK